MCGARSPACVSILAIRRRGKKRHVTQGEAPHPPRIARHLERLAADTLAPLGLDPGEFDVLASLLRAGPPHEVTPTVLNESLMMSAGGLTKRLGKLEERELITRRLSSGDRRNLLVTLTARGKDLATKAVLAHTKATAGIVDAIGPEAREQLSDLLRQLLTNFEGSPSAGEHESPQRSEEPALRGGDV
ncbi:MarR family winged helix-turn-helix transcriptional regulator [Amycolatopsis pigmentata]|uniref:MarR family winged helix-turn-helix transcriptional regulator n=1 Tax=Amycolatopsis pigmentata TaxID=450801 RepID=A0ABW5G6Q8_9PSEU